MVPGSFTVHPWANAALEEVKMLLDGEKLPELGEVELETIFNELRSEDLQHLGCTRAACSLQKSQEKSSPLETPRDLNSNSECTQSCATGFCWCSLRDLMI